MNDLEGVGRNTTGNQIPDWQQDTMTKFPVSCLDEVRNIIRDQILEG